MVVGEPHWHLYAQKMLIFSWAIVYFIPFPHLDIYIYILLLIIIIITIIIIYKAYKHLGKYLNLCWT